MQVFIEWLARFFAPEFIDMIILSVSTILAGSGYFFLSGSDRFRRWVYGMTGHKALAPKDASEAMRRLTSGLSQSSRDAGKLLNQIKSMTDELLLGLREMEEKIERLEAQEQDLKEKVEVWTTPAIKQLEKIKKGDENRDKKYLFAGAILSVVCNYFYELAKKHWGVSGVILSASTVFIC